MRVYERPRHDAIPFEPYICVSVKTMDDLCAADFWHCGGLSERTNVQMLRLPVASRSKAMGRVWRSFFFRLRHGIT